MRDIVDRLDIERNRLLQQLDKVCEEKDEQIKQLKTQMYEKQVEADNQLTLFKEEKKALHDEISVLKGSYCTNHAPAYRKSMTRRHGSAAGSARE